MKVKIGKKIFEEGEAYATTMNTLGIGDPVPAANIGIGSGDKFVQIGTMSTKAPIKKELKTSVKRKRTSKSKKTRKV